jgi:aspartyl/asparaginyl beta-hydroxylase (cupin superfamily)
MKLSPGQNPFLYSLISRAGQWLIRFVEFILSYFSIEKGAIIDTKKYPWTAYLEGHSDLILGELNAVMARYHDIPNFGTLSEEQNRIIKGEQNWKTFMLYTYGAPVPKNQNKCPYTDKIIKEIPGMTTAFFSILEPHTRLIPHRGPYKGVLRYHLGLIVPDDPSQCGIRVDDTVHHWQAGQSLIFDDTHMHEAWNDSGQKRVVLFIDFKRDYPFPINLLNNAMIKLIQLSPFISNMLKQLEK